MDIFVSVLYEEKPEPGPTFKDFVTNPHFMYFVALPIVVTVLAIISCIVLSQQKRKLKRRLQERLVLETDVPTQNQSELTSTRYGRGPLANATILAHHGAINLAIDSQGSSCEPLMTSSRLPDTSNSKALGKLHLLCSFMSYTAFLFQSRFFFLSGRCQLP